LKENIISKISKKLVSAEPEQGGLRLAAVAMILKDLNNPQVLLIKRSERPTDPWSGQIALPGGKMQAGDLSAKETATRETSEEVGIDLHKAEFLGYAEVIPTHTGTMRVVPCVFVLKQEVDVVPNGEVASYRWVDLKELLLPETRSTYELNYGGRSVEMPAYVLGDYVVWGLTYRILSLTLQYE
jgi:8-oxo-dGTP pyrophosphatase MutT (NUDIX family)